MTRILAIEDSAAIREYIREVLLLEEYEVLEAENGLIGVDLAHEHIPDLIVCDVVMPELNGYGVLLQLRSDPATSAIPFVFLTGRDSRDEIREGMALGADDYLSKPFTSEELLTAVKSRLERHIEITTEYEKKVDDFRTSLLHMLPHEFRTPMTTILGYAEMMMGDTQGMSANQVNMVKTIHKGGVRLQHLLENFLLFSQLEMLKQDSAQIEKLRQYAVSSPKLQIEHYATAVAQRLHREADLRLNIADIDQIRMTQDSLKKIIEELVDNAFKFSDPGTAVQVTGTVAEDEFVLQISNQGRGMTAAQIANVAAYKQFQRQIFEQQGAGLGLIITKTLAELYGGTFSIESVPQQQTEVCVTFSVG